MSKIKMICTKEERYDVFKSIRCPFNDPLPERCEEATYTCDKCMEENIEFEIIE